MRIESILREIEIRIKIHLEIASVAYGNDRDNHIAAANALGETIPLIESYKTDDISTNKEA